MNTKIAELIKDSASSNQPVLSAFVDLKSEDHSFKKIRSLLIKAQNDLETAGAKIDKLDEILKDNMITGKELNFGDIGLTEVNAAIYVTKDRVFSFRVNRRFSDQFTTNQFPFILPLIKNNFSNIKAMVVNRLFVKLYEFENDDLKLLEDNFPLLDEEENANTYDNQILQDRDKDRRDELVRRYVKKIMTKAANERFNRNDKILVLAKESFLNPVKHFLQESQWKKNFVVEKRNFDHFKEKEVKESFFKAVEKNKMNHFQPLEERNARNYHSINTIKKEIGRYNLKSLMINDALVESSLNQIERDQELNQFLINLIESDVQVSSYENMEDNFSVDLQNIDERKFMGQF